LGRFKAGASYSDEGGRDGGDEGGRDGGGGGGGELRRLVRVVEVETATVDPAA
jgi:hypothetical protein